MKMTHPEYCNHKYNLSGSGWHTVVLHTSYVNFTSQVSQQLRHIQKCQLDNAAINWQPNSHQPRATAGDPTQDTINYLYISLYLCIHFHQHPISILLLLCASESRQVDSAVSMYIQTNRLSRWPQKSHKMN